MLDTFKELAANQMEAALWKLDMCVERCPEPDWSGPVANLTFSQVAFHALFFADYYLGENEDALRRQPFHRDNETFFGNYEELLDRPQQRLYDKPSIRRYVEHCRGKAADTVAAETAETLAARCGFPHLEFSRAELYVYNIRHLQHHAAQLSLRLRLDFDEGIPWQKSGWREE